MRRSDREITDMDRIMEIVRRQSVCCVAFQDTPCPYLIPMNYGAALDLSLIHLSEPTRLLSIECDRFG